MLRQTTPGKTYTTQQAHTYKAHAKYGKQNGDRKYYKKYSIKQLKREHYKKDANRTKTLSGIHRWI